MEPEPNYLYYISVLISLRVFFYFSILQFIETTCDNRVAGSLFKTIIYLFLHKNNQ